MKQSYKEALKYGLVGAIGLGIEWISFFILRDAFNINYIISHIISSILAITNNFILNSRFTFMATDKIVRRAASFFGIAIIGLFISTSLLPVFVKILNWLLNYTDLNVGQKVVQAVGKLGATGIVVILQFFLNKYLTFKKNNHEEQFKSSN
jgi:putative flippase GtrA